MSERTSLATEGPAGVEIQHVILDRVLHLEFELLATRYYNIDTTVRVCRLRPE
jgi:hypothetical protein